MAGLIDELDAELAGLREHDLFRQLLVVEDVSGAVVKRDGRWLVCWCANDYLGLSQHPRLIRAAHEAAVRWGIGSRGSRLLAGTTSLHEELEASLAAFFGTESAVVFPSGYLANLGALTSLAHRGDLVLVDRLAHASLIDAARATGAMFRVFRHHDAEDVGKLLSRYRRVGRKIVVTEGLFSMDGDHAPLDRLLEASREHEALLYVDDAHGAFATGETGRGTPELFGLDHQDLIYMATLGKALGCQGGFVAGPRSLIALLHNRARTFIYETALATPLVAAAREALELISEDPGPRMLLARHVQYLHARLGALGHLRDRRPTHIVPILAGSSARALALSQMLAEQGMLAPAIRPPTVPEGTARLRISLSALHTDNQLGQLSRLLGEWLSAQAS